MKCPNCNQEIIDNKTFCPNCGKQLKKINNEVKNNTKYFLIFVVIMILLGLGTIYTVGNVGTKEELKRIISKDKEQIEDFYDSYIIKNILINEKTPKEIIEQKDSIVGYELELSKENFKLGLFKINWIKINKPDVFKVKDISKYKEDLKIEGDNVHVISIEGFNVEENGKKREQFYIISHKSKLYLNYMDTYFELSKSNLGFKSLETYYKVNLLEQKYPESINKIIKERNDKIKETIQNNTYKIYENYAYEYIDKDITHLVFNELQGEVNAGFISNIKTLSFDNMGEKINLKKYIESIGKNYDEFEEQYKELRNKKLEGKEDMVSKFELNPELMYYVKEGILYIACGTDSWETLFINIDLN